MLALRLSLDNPIRPRLSSYLLKTSALFLIPSLSACGTMGFPHIGTVDTRHQAPGTVNAQLSGGIGAIGVIYPFAPAAGASIAADSYLTPRLSLTTSGHVLAAAIPGEVSGSARMGLRLRPNQKLSLGLGAMGGVSRMWERNRANFNYGGDLEVATSRTRPKDRFASHAWRLSVVHSTHEYLTGTFLGDWSRSRPTKKNKDVRFSYGLNYGLNLGTSTSRPETSDDSPGPSRTGSDFGYFFGVHLGMQWGGKWGHH